MIYNCDYTFIWHLFQSTLHRCCLPNNTRPQQNSMVFNRWQHKGREGQDNMYSSLHGSLFQSEGAHPSKAIMLH